MLKFGNISQVDAAKGRARVKFDGEDGIVSGWLPMSQAKTLQDKFIIPFDVNEHVWCMMDDNLEHGVIGGAIYDESNNATGGADRKIRLQFVGGLFAEFDRNTNTLAIGGTGDFNIDISGTGKGKVNISCNQAVINSLTSAEIIAVTEIKLTAPLVTVSGTLAVAAITMTGAGSISGATNITATGIIEGGTVKQGLIVLGTHKHTGVTTGAGISGTPTP